MQAGELAKSAGDGAAWAAQLGSRADIERRHADDIRAVYDTAMTAMADVARSRGEPAPVVAAPTIPVAAAAQPARSCTSYGAAIKPDARFCGATV